MKRDRRRVGVGVAGVALLLGAVACRPLTSEPLHPLGSGLLVRVNDAGLAVGSSVEGTGQSRVIRPVRVDLRTGIVTTLPDPHVGTFNVASDVNANGVTVGVSSGAAGGEAVRWDPAHGDAVELVPDLGGQSQAVALNDHGVIVGGSATATDTNPHAFTYDPGTNAVTDLGTLGGPTSIAGDINDAGLVVGAADLADGSSRGFLYDPGTGVMSALPAAPAGYPRADATAIDDSGNLVVGEAFPAFTNPTATGSVALIYDRRTSSMLALDPLGGHDASATDVDDRGIVVGTATTPSGETHGFAYDTQTQRTVDLGSVGGHVGYLGTNDRLDVVGFDFGPNVSPRVTTTFTTRLHTSPDATPAPTVSGCGGTATVAWTPPAFDGNDPITTYVVQRDGQTIATVDDGVSAITDSVAIGSTTHYTVTAGNVDGLSVGSPAVAFTSTACGR